MHFLKMFFNIFTGSLLCMFTIYLKLHLILWYFWNVYVYDHLWLNCIVAYKCVISILLAVESTKQDQKNNGLLSDYLKLQ